MSKSVYLIDLANQKIIAEYANSKEASKALDNNLINGMKAGNKYILANILEVFSYEQQIIKNECTSAFLNRLKGDISEPILSPSASYSVKQVGKTEVIKPKEIVPSEKIESAQIKKPVITSPKKKVSIKVTSNITEHKETNTNIEEVKKKEPVTEVEHGNTNEHISFTDITKVIDNSNKEVTPKVNIEKLEDEKEDEELNTNLKELENFIEEEQSEVEQDITF